MVTKEILKNAKTTKGESLYDLSLESSVMIVFLRHLGCVFCQEAIIDLRGLMKKGALSDVKLVFVHMAEASIAEEYFEELDITAENHISDQECHLYENFGLVKATTRELFSFQVMLRTAENAVLKGNLPGRKRIGDGFQMPGVFILEQGKIKESYIHKRISDRPDYGKMLECCAI